MTQRRDNHPKRKRIRLDPSLYTEPGVVALITIAARDRESVFRNHCLAQSCIEALSQQADYNEIAVLAYCFMPDHAHLLLRVDGATGIIAFIHALKIRTTRHAWDHDLTGSLWQQSFYDHLVREHEDPGKYIRYILENPIRGGLVDQWRAYPFSGSFTYTFDDDSLWDTR